MRRLPIAVAAAMLILVSSIDAVAAQSLSDIFHALTERFIEYDLRTYPEGATDNGDHRFDHDLTDVSRSAIQHRIDETKKWKHDFEAFVPDHLSFAPEILSPEDEADREWLIAQLDGRLLDAEQLRTYERAPDEYLAIDSLNSLIKRDFAPLPKRMASATGRERAALHNLAVARANLKPDRTAKVTVDITLEQMPGTIEFLQKDLPDAFASIPPGSAKNAFLKSNAKLIAAMGDYAQWLKNDFAPHATGNYAIGRDAFQRMLADQEMVDLSVADLD